MNNQDRFQISIPCHFNELSDMLLRDFFFWQNYVLCTIQVPMTSYKVLRRIKVWPWIDFDVNNRNWSFL